MLVFHVDMTYISTNIAQGIMGYPLWDLVDTVDLAGPTGQCLRSNEETGENLG